MLNSDSTKIELTEDMVETLAKYFNSYSKDGILQIECNDGGLWLINPNVKSVQFLGKAKKPTTTGRTSNIDLQHHG